MKKKDKFLEELVRVLNRYLETIGVYSLIPNTGAKYDGEVLACYNGTINNGEIKNNPPRIVEIQLPAYCVKYRDEDDNVDRYCLEGKCVYE